MTENRILNGSVILVAGSDIEGMRLFLQRIICRNVSEARAGGPGRRRKEKDDAVLSFGADGFIRPFETARAGFQEQDIRRAVRTGDEAGGKRGRFLMIGPAGIPDTDISGNGGKAGDGNKGNIDGFINEIRSILNDAVSRKKKMLAVFILYGNGCLPAFRSENDAGGLYRNGAAAERPFIEKAAARLRLASETVIELRIEENGGRIERYIVAHRLSVGDPVDRKIGYIIRNGEIVVEQTKRVY